jgi:hypothetical protein
MTADFLNASKPEERREEKEKVEKGSSEKHYFFTGKQISGFVISQADLSSW